MSARDVALRRIAEARATCAGILDLGDLEIDVLPEELGGLPALRVLALGRFAVCHEEGNLKWTFKNDRACHSFSDLGPLASLTSLHTLDLSDCVGITDLGPLASLTGLHTLNLRRCDGITELDPLASLTGLHTLNLDWCNGITELGALASLTALHTLDLGGCDGITELDPLASLPYLHTIDLFGCRRITELGPLASLTGLHTLILADCDGITELGPLVSLTALHTLCLSWCKGIRALGALASLTALHTLDLCGCDGITELGPLASLTSLDSLDLSNCKGITELGPLASLTALDSLYLSNCKGITELGALATLTSLHSLDLSDCDGITELGVVAGLSNLHTLRLDKCPSLRRVAPLYDLLPQLTHLSLFGCRFEDLDPAVYGESPNENTLKAVRAHYVDLAFGASDAAELRVMVLGNGGVGKTQLCNRLCGRPYDPSGASTHGVQIDHIDVSFPDRATPVRLNLWDFGGQDIYHGSHALFLQSSAVFLLVWTPQTEDGEYKDGDGEVQLTFRHRPLIYWLEYIRSVAGTDNRVLIIEGKCDNVSDQRPLPGPLPEGFTWLRCLDFSAQVDEKVTNLRSTLKQAVRELLDRRPAPLIGKGRVRLRQRLHKMLEEDRQREKPRARTLTQSAFRRLCDKNGEIDDPDEMLKFLHRSGALFWQPDVFEGLIILDQSWALDAIYALFHRAKVLPTLFGKGRFTLEGLAALVWRDRPEAYQLAFLGMMESCGICFRCRQINPGVFPKEWEYVAPELLPGRESPEVQRELAGGRIPKIPAAARAEVRYRFFHEGVVRRFLSWLGRRAGDSAVYWRFGCWFCDPKDRGGILIDSRWGDDPQQPRQGTVTLDVWGEEPAQLLEPLVATLTEVSFSEKPEVIFTGVIKAQAVTHRHDGVLPLHDPDVVYENRPDLVLFLGRLSVADQDALMVLAFIADICEREQTVEFTQKIIAKKMQKDPPRISDSMKHAQKLFDCYFLKRRDLKPEPLFERGKGNHPVVTTRGKLACEVARAYRNWFLGSAPRRWNA